MFIDQNAKESKTLNLVKISAAENPNNNRRKKNPDPKMTLFIKVSYLRCIKYPRTKEAFAVATAIAMITFIAPKSIPATQTVTNVKKIKVAKIRE